MSRETRSGSLTVTLTCSMRGVGMARSPIGVLLFQTNATTSSLLEVKRGGMASQVLLSIGELAQRTGMSVSAIRFYESRGLQRRFLRADIRRLSFAQIAQ